jgi:glycosyltransferase involved in cell wall biosynthesis
VPEAAADGGDSVDGGRLRVALDATPLMGRSTGVGNFCAGALLALGARGDLDVHAFAVSWRRRGEIGSRLPAGVRSEQHSMPARPLHSLWNRGNYPPIEWFIGPADVVHGTNFVVPPTRTAARVVTVHDLTAVRFPELCDAPSLRFPSLIRRAVAAGAWVHTPSAFVADEVIEAFGVPPEHVRAVHSGIPPLEPLLDPSPAERERPARTSLPAGVRRYLLAVGTAEPRKDLPGLVRAFDALAADRLELGLVLVGADGWGAAALDEAVAASPFAARIVRTGWATDSARAGLLIGAAALVYPSLYEGFGFPPLEAMAAGVPVVASRVGALPEVLGDAAALVTAGDVDALAGAIAAIVDSPERAEAYVSSGRRRAAEFSWDLCAEGLAALYRDAVASRG